MKNECSEEQFLKDVADHQLTVIRDDGLYRHLRIKKEGTRCYWFDIVTWPGYLSITGDCGDYLFTRVEDMFSFFRRKQGGINPQYWEEKCVAVCSQSPTKRYDEEAARAGINDLIEQINEDREEKVSAEDIHNVITYDEGRHEFARSVYYIDAEIVGGCSIDSESIPDAQSWGFHYIWCLYAIVFAIGKYDALPEETVSAA